MRWTLALAPIATVAVASGLVACSFVFPTRESGITGPDATSDGSIPSADTGGPEAPFAHVGACEAGASTTCNTYGTQTCSDDGEWSACTCASAPICTPVTDSCLSPGSGNAPVVCNSCGQWPAGAQCQVTYDYEDTADGGTYTFLVPTGVGDVAVMAVGAAGGASCSTKTAGTAPAGGASVTASVPVKGGETLWIYLGGAGGTPPNCSGSLLGQGTPGANGGGAGSGGGGGGGGGGATDVRQGQDAVASRIIVAAGGGGDGEGAGAGGGGAGGASAGTSGTGAPELVGGGQGGTQTGPGAGGAFLGAGGDAGAGGTGGSVYISGGGGGGGGGYYGGGGGGGGPLDGVGGGGGGGSSYAAPSLSNVSISPGGPRTGNGNGQVTITWTW